MLDANAVVAVAAAVAAAVAVAVVVAVVFTDLHPLRCITMMASAALPAAATVTSTRCQKTITASLDNFSVL